MAREKACEVSATSAHSFGDAVRQGIADANGTLRTLRRAWITDQRVRVGEDSKVEYQVDLRVTFGGDEERP
jgi:dodecin